MKVHRFLPILAAAMLVAGCGASVSPLADTTGAGGDAGSGLAIAPGAAGAAGMSGATSGERAAAEEELARDLAREQATTASSTAAAPGVPAEQTVEEQMRLRELFKRGELGEDLPLPENN